MQAKLWRRKDDASYVVRATGDKMPKGLLEDVKLESLAWYNVPDRTRFTKTPHWDSGASKNEMIEGLREQLRYWRLQMFGEVANELNEGNGDAEKHDRYRDRAIACSIFLKALQENPRLKDTTMLREHDVDAENHISKKDLDSTRAEK